LNISLIHYANEYNSILKLKKDMSTKFLIPKINNNFRY
jgi:hypothetical protein